MAFFEVLKILTNLIGGISGRPTKNPAIRRIFLF